MRRIAILTATVAAGVCALGAGAAYADGVDIDADNAADHAAQHVLDHANVGPIDVLHDGILNDADLDLHEGALNDLGGVLNLGDVLGDVLG